jgi:hypothetical protein
MARINTTFTAFPAVPKRTQDAPLDFVLKWETYEDFRSTTNYNELTSFIPEANALRDEVNTFYNNTLAYRDTTKIYRDESLANKDLSLQYKTAAELAYNNTETLLNTLVIPTEATYNYQEADNKFQYKTDSFLNFNIGE